MIKSYVSMKAANFLVVVALLMVATACKNDEPGEVCGVADPVKDLPWLKAQIENLSKDNFAKWFYIVQAKTDDGYVFITHSCCPVCDYIPLYYDCNGNRVDPKSIKRIKEQKRIWVSENNECVFTQ